MSSDSTPDVPPLDAQKPAAAKRRAFPVKKLVISAVGIAVAVWVWLGSGWRWDVTPRELAEGRAPLAIGSWVGRYARLASEQKSGRVILARSEDSRTVRVVDPTRGRWNGRAVAAVVMLIWGLVHAGASVYVWRQRRLLISAPAPTTPPRHPAS